MNINILIIGKSGAGKSTLLNYLWGKEIAGTGIGKPVTPRQSGKELAIYKHAPVDIGGNNLVIFDSWGLEADKSDEWLNTVIPELEKRESSGDANDWMHAIIYCIGASGARVEPFETQEIVQNLEKAGQNVVFALTKAGRASSDELKGIREAIKKDCPNNSRVIEIESLNDKLRNGKETKQQGRDHLLNAITDELIKKLKHKWETQYLKKAEELCKKWKSITLNYYDEESGFFTFISTTLEKTGNFSEKKLKHLMKELNKWKKKSLEQIIECGKAFEEIMNCSSTHSKFDKLNSDFSKKTVKLDFETLSAHYAMYAIPLINVIAVFASNSVHRDDLEDKLDKTIAGIIKDVKSQILTAWL
jgi:predicted GTPase